MSRQNPFRRKQCVKVILNALEMAGPWALPEITLQEHCIDLIKPPMQPEEFSELIKELSDRGAITAIEDDLDESLKQWAITQLGRTIRATN